MKIFNIENGVKKVYVQLNDIAALMHLSDFIPASIMERFFSQVFIVTDENRFDFEEFSDSRDVEFFSNVDWIVDFDVYSALSEKDIIDVGQEMTDSMNSIAIQANEISDKSSQEYEELVQKHETLDFKIKSLSEVLLVKQGHRIMPFPIVPRHRGFSLRIDENKGEYLARQGLNPMQYLIFKADGTPFDEKKDIIPAGFIASADSLCVSSNIESNEFFGDFSVNRKLSDDKKYLISTMQIIVPDEEKENQKSEKKGKKSFGKKLINKVSQFWKKTDN